MEFKVKYLDSYKDAFALLKRTIDERIVDLDQKYYVIVPDDCTIMTECLLFKDSGAFDVEVLTFNRLFNKLASLDNYLPRQGAVMLLKRVVLSVQNELRFFSRSATRLGFSQKMYDTLNLLITSDISPSDLDLYEDKTGKIYDIKLIYAKYLEASKGHFMDAAGRMELLKQRASETDFSYATFIFLGFDSFTKQQKKVIFELEKSAKDGIIFESLAPKPILGGVELYNSADDADQLKAAAKRIRELVINGARYLDIAIISPSLVFEKAKRILTEFDIPFFIDKKEVLGETPLAKYFMTLDKIIDTGYRASDFVSLSKNPFSNISLDDADVFENYCLKFCIDYKRFFEPFTIIDIPKWGSEADGLIRLSIAESVRKKIVKQVNDFTSLKAQVSSAKDFYEFVARVCTFAVADTIDIKEQETQKKKLCEAAQILQRIYGDSFVKFEELFELFCEGLKVTVYSVLPKYCDVVTIGGCSSFRAQSFDHVFVIDFCEGVIPPHKDDIELLCDADIDALCEANLVVEPKVSSQNQKAVRDFLFSVTQTKSLFLGFSDSNDKRKSELYSFFLCADKLTKTCFEDENNFDFNPQNYTQADLVSIANGCSTKSNALELLLISKSLSEAGERAFSFSSELDALFSNGEYKRFIDKARLSHSLLNQDKPLKFANNTTSITQLQQYFSCPYSAFLKYFVKLFPREEGRLSTPETGNFLHRAAQDFIALNDFSTPCQSMRLVCERISTENKKYLFAPNKAVIQRLIDEAVKLAPVLAHQITGGLFTPLYTEKRFCRNENVNNADRLNTISLKTKYGDVNIIGVIDRVDVYGKYARVIDYKSGDTSRSDFDFAALYRGQKLQLLVYLAVLRANGYKPCGGFYFPFSGAWDDDGFTHRLKGIYDNSPFVLTAMDRELENSGVTSCIINAKRKVAKKVIHKDDLRHEDFCSKHWAFSSSELELLCDYALEVMTEAANEIQEGTILASPCEGVCSYCEYKSVCGKSANVQERKKISVKPKTIIEIQRGNSK